MHPFPHKVETEKGRKERKKGRQGERKGGKERVGRERIFQDLE